MKVTYVLLFSLAIFQGSLAKIVRIAGGKTRTIQELPYQASLILHESSGQEFHLCGASIISEEWLLTSADCFNKIAKNNLTVRTGATKISNKDGEEHIIKQMIPHPEFKMNELNDNFHFHNIGLIQLTEPIKFSDVQKPIPLARPLDIPFNGEIVTVSGYGKDGERPSNRTATLQLKSADLTIVPLEKCLGVYLDLITENMICAGVNIDSPCVGDFGSPGIVYGRLAGVVADILFL